MEDGTIGRVEFERAKNKFLEHPCKDTCSGYKQGFEAGQASRTPIKWPEPEIVGNWAGLNDCFTAEERLGFFRGANWLKSFVEKGKSE